MLKAKKKFNWPGTCLFLGEYICLVTNSEIS